MDIWFIQIPCIMFWMRAYPLQGQVGGGWALEIESFLGTVKCHRANRWVSFGAQKTRGRFQGLYCGGWGSRCIKELNRPALAAPPSTLIRNQEETVRYIICASRCIKEGMRKKDRGKRYVNDNYSLPFPPTCSTSVMLSASISLLLFR